MGEKGSSCACLLSVIALRVYAVSAYTSFCIESRDVGGAPGSVSA